MITNEIFHLNYYVGSVLAQGGNVSFDDSKITFSPTSSIDRALGASDVEIPFLKIQGVEFKGDMMKAFHIKTQDRLHKFQGSQARKAWEALAKVLQDKGMRPMPKPQPRPAAASPFGASACSQCSARIETSFIFCPMCGARIKSN